MGIRLEPLRTRCVRSMDVEQLRFIDTHAHIYGEEYGSDLSEVIERARQVGACAVFLPSTDLETAAQCEEVARRYPGFCYPMIGLHPENLPARPLDVVLSIEDRLAHDNPYIAVGEIGLDFYWDSSRAEEQVEVFRRQLQLALRFRLPVMIHCRKAHRELLALLSEFKPAALRGVFHCFSGSIEQAQELLAYPNFCLGIGGVVTFKNAKLPSVLASIPLERVVLETDSPYMSPVPLRGTRNEPANIVHIIRKLSEIYNLPPAAIAEQTTINARRLFLPESL